MVSIAMPRVDVYLDELSKEGSQELTIKMTALYCLHGECSITESWN